MSFRANRRIPITIPGIASSQGFFVAPVAALLQLLRMTKGDALRMTKWGLTQSGKITDPSLRRQKGMLVPHIKISPAWKGIIY
jgi:hypothetical protein